MHADVGVIGLGIMGSMAMWQLAKRNISVIGFEQFGTGHDRSAAGGESRLFRTAYMEGLQYVPLLQEARVLWKQLEKETGTNLLTLNGGLMIGSPDLGAMRSVMQCIERYDLDHEYFEKSEAERRFPQHRLFTGEIMILDKNAGFLRPELAVVTTVQHAEHLGAKIFRYTKVEEISPDRDGVTIKTEEHTYRVGKVLVTAGPWTGMILPKLAKKIKARRLVLTWFTAKNIKQFESENFPIFARMGIDFRLTGVPSLDRSMVKVSNTFMPNEMKHPDELDRNVTVEEISRVGRAVETYLPDLIPYPVRASVYMDAYTPDHHAVVGNIPGMKNVFLMSGFSGHGFKMSPVMGKIVTDLILGGKTEYSIDFLSVSRLVHSNKQ